MSLLLDSQSHLYMSLFFKLLRTDDAVAPQVRNFQYSSIQYYWPSINNNEVTLHSPFWLRQELTPTLKPTQTKQLSTLTYPTAVDWLFHFF